MTPGLIRGWQRALFRTWVRLRLGLRWPWRWSWRPRSLTLRVALTVLAGFTVIFFVLMALMTWNAFGHETGELDKALLRATQSMARMLDAEDSEESARIFVSMMGVGMLGDTEEDPPLRLVVRRLSNQRRFATPDLAWLDNAQVKEGRHTLQHGGTTWRLYTFTGQRWRVTTVDDETARSKAVLRNLGWDIAWYLLVALPFVLVPVWLAVRAGLAPLRRLSNAVTARAPHDMRSLPTSASYSELQPLETALNVQFKQAAQSIQRERAFVNDAAHELRTPLAVISTQAHLLAHSEGAERTRASERLQAAITRASHLTQQLLRLAQADAAAHARLETVDLMNLLRSAMADIAQRARAQGTELDLVGPDQLPLTASGTALRSIVDNLLDNALRYGGPGGVVRVRVKLPAGAPSPPQAASRARAPAPTPTVQLSVSDTGPGIAPELREQAFERFWRSPQATQPGSGLGLAIVREAARSLGGQAHMEGGAEGAGCTVVVTLGIGSVNGPWPAATTLS